MTSAASVLVVDDTPANIGVLLEALGDAGHEVLVAESGLSALAQLQPFFAGLGGPWTARVPLPGGDFPHDGFAALVARLRADHPWLSEGHARRLCRAYGTEAAAVIGNARGPGDLGRDFGATLTGAEVDWLMAREYARTAEDVVWRRSKLGLRMTPAEIAALDAEMAARHAPAPLREVI